MRFEWLLLCRSAWVDYGKNLADIKGAGLTSIRLDDPAPVRVEIHLVAKMVEMPEQPGDFVALRFEVLDPQGALVHSGVADGWVHETSPPVSETLDQGSMMFHIPIDFPVLSVGRFTLRALPGGQEGRHVVERTVVIEDASSDPT